ncbi:Rho-binding antiterminator [Candidatus Steffania adelgidicola]|uniref:Rho-binding antiterminator n=1 Tax=Candidatus Steffania adelgidicola TaxID=1076626 RepID=UPI001D01F05E|nr:Rho-binding antiterminator [Candidatus Steffania adelgidicola]
MTMNEEYQPINCDDYDNLELACTRHWVLHLTLRTGETISGAACEIRSRKRVEYLVIKYGRVSQEIRLDYITNFTHPKLGTVVVSAE